MTPEIFFVKNMVSHRCILAVEDVLGKSGIPFKHVVIGEIHLIKKIPQEQTGLLAGNLTKIGLELILITNNDGKIKKYGRTY
ncbi:MAG: hypothetical protein ABIR18_15980 [Chitinophagaceae bacterium]